MPQLIQQAQLSEALGYYGLWFTDTQLLAREVYVTLAACALRTSRIKLATGVTMPHTRHPSVTASAFATLDELAPGRLRLGISIGDNGLRTIGRGWATIREMEDYVRTLRTLLENRPARFEEGVQGKVAWMEAPVSAPIYIAASGPRLTRAAGRIGDGVILLRALSPGDMQMGVRVVREEALKAGRRPEQIDIATWVQSSIGSDRALARIHARGLVAEVLQMVRLEMFDEADQPAVRHVKENYDFYRQNLFYGKDRAPIHEKFIDMFSFAGDPFEVREKVQELMMVEGLDEIIVCPQHLEGSPGPSVEGTIRLFAEEVMAYLA